MAERRRRNIKMLDEEMPAYQIGKQAQLDQLAHEAQVRPTALAGLWVLLAYVVGIGLLVWWLA